MLDILKAMMEDATEYPWPNVRNFYWIVGPHVENDRLKWTVNRIQCLRVKHAQKHDIPTKQLTPAARQTDKIRHCALYQKGQCTEKAEHAGLKHVCPYCLRTIAAPYPHPESDCRRNKANKQPKICAGVRRHKSRHCVLALEVQR